jgi:bacterial/archaeal transporter family protein
MAGWFWLSMIALVFFGITGVTQKVSTNHISTPFSFVGFTVAFIPIAVFTYWYWPVNLALAGDVIALGIACGVLNGFGALTSFAAFESGGKASIVMPIISLYPLVTVLGARLFLHEHITAMQWAGIAIAPVAAWLLSTGEE